MEGLHKGKSDATSDRKHLFSQLSRYRSYCIGKTVPETLVFKNHTVLIDRVRAHLSDYVHFVDLGPVFS